MKLNRILFVCGILAALYLSVGNLAAQNTSNPDSRAGQNHRPGGGPGGNFDPAQFQERIMERVRERLGFTNDTDWNAVQPLVVKVMDTQRDARSGMVRGMFGNRSRSGDNKNSDQGNRFGGFGQPNPEAEALERALDANAPAGQIKDLLAKYQASQKAKQAKLEKAQSDLRKVLTMKQEAQATLMGLLN